MSLTLFVYVMLQATIAGDRPIYLANCGRIDSWCGQ